MKRVYNGKSRFTKRASEAPFSNDQAVVNTALSFLNDKFGGQWNELRFWFRNDILDELEKYLSGHPAEGIIADIHAYLTYDMAFEGPQAIREEMFPTLLKHALRHFGNSPTAAAEADESEIEEALYETLDRFYYEDKNLYNELRTKFFEHIGKTSKLNTERKNAMSRYNRRSLAANRKRANKELALVVFDQIGGEIWESVSDDLYDMNYDSVVDYMSQWDYGEYHDFESESYLESVGYVVDMGHYVLSYTHTRAPFVALYAKTGTTSHRANRKGYKSKLDLYFSAFNRAGQMVEITAKPDGNGYIWSYQGPDYDDYDQMLITLPFEEAYNLFLKEMGLTQGDSWGPEIYTHTGNRRANRKRASVMSLDDALQEVANASFHEDKQITPETDGNGNIIGYRVENDYGMNTEDWEWTYDKGVMDTDSVSETSRLMESYEQFTNAGHIRYHMSESVEALENGQTVTFAYALVSDADAIFDDETQEYYDAYGDPTDDVAGWILTADWF